MPITDITKISHQPLGEMSYLILVGLIIIASLLTLIIKSYYSDRKLRFTTTNISEFIKVQTEFNSSMSSIIILLTRDKISECSLGQVKIISQCVIDAFLTDVIYGVMDIITKNQLHKKAMVDNRIDIMVDNAVKCASSYLDLFVYNGKSLTYMIDQNQWKCKTVQVCKDTIYTEQEKLKYLFLELQSLKKTLRNDYYERLKHKFSENTISQQVN